jgi:hypothetical protein
MAPGEKLMGKPQFDMMKVSFTGVGPEFASSPSILTAYPYQSRKVGPELGPTL